MPPRALRSVGLAIVFGCSLIPAPTFGAPRFLREVATGFPFDDYFFRLKQVSGDGSGNFVAAALARAGGSLFVRHFAKDGTPLSSVITATNDVSSPSDSDYGIFSVAV